MAIRRFKYGLWVVVISETIGHHGPKVLYRKLIEAFYKRINKQRPWTGTTNMKFYHDNSRPHATQMVKSHLNHAKFTIIRKSPNQTNALVIASNHGLTVINTSKVKKFK